MSITVVLGYDGSPAGERALDQAAGEVRRAGGGRVVVVTAYEENVAYPTAASIEPPFVPALAEDELELAEKYALELALKAEERLKAAGVECEHVVSDMDPADALMTAAADHRAGMVIVGGHRHGALAGIFGGSTTQRLLHHCALPVLVVPPPD